ncbi:NUDIX domain-containing protein [Oerskovia sp. M15]
MTSPAQTQHPPGRRRPRRAAARSCLDAQPPPGPGLVPRGRLDDSDTDLVDAALREAVEETGLDRDGVEVLGALSPLPCP